MQTTCDAIVANEFKHSYTCAVAGENSRAICVRPVWALLGGGRVCEFIEDVLGEWRVVRRWCGG